MLSGEGRGELSATELASLGGAASRWLSDTGLIVARIPAGVKPSPLAGVSAGGATEGLGAVVVKT